MKLVLERAWVKGEDMIALWIRPQYLIWVRERLADRESEKVEPANFPAHLLKLYKENGNFRLLESYRCGSDGHPSLITIWKLLIAPGDISNTAIHYPCAKS